MSSSSQPDGHTGASAQESELHQGSFGHAFITRIDAPEGEGLRLAVKDCIDVAGYPTTAGCAVIGERADAATTDAKCLVGARLAGVTIVGKTNLHELCFGATGVNPHYRTPVNPLDPARIPGGSSSGSAVAVANHWADVAYGTDTAGSIRNPAACCGIVGLKTTFGRIPVAGARPLAPSMDSIGPMARDIAGVVAGMALLETGFLPGVLGDRPLRVARFRGVDATAEINTAVDSALAATRVEVIDVELEGWRQADLDGRTLMYAEALKVNADLVENHRDRLGTDVVERLDTAALITPAELAEVRCRHDIWRRELESAWMGFDAIALPAYPSVPAFVAKHDPASNSAVVAVSFAGNPALAMPIPTSEGPLAADGRPFPASLQLVGGWGTEELLVAIGALVESAVS